MGGKEGGQKGGNAQTSSWGSTLGNGGRGEDIDRGRGSAGHWKAGWGRKQQRAEYTDDPHTHTAVRAACELPPRLCHEWRRPNGLKLRWMVTRSPRMEAR
eukprot:EG_transcript_52098